jgi:hypothetical protein
MNARRVVPIFACAIACVGLACQKRITSTAIMVPANFQTAITVNPGGIIQFVSQGNEGAYFTVSFAPPLACNGQPGAIVGSPTHAAVCRVPLNSYGRYDYTIAPSNALSAAIRSGVLIVDHCPGCKPLADKLLPPPPSRADNPPTVLIVCDGNAAKADPVKASAGQVVLWSQKGSDKIKWTATFEDDICEGGKKTFGTKEADTPHSCVIKSGAPAGDHKYQVTLSEGCTNPGYPILTIPQNTQ